MGTERFCARERRYWNRRRGKGAKGTTEGKARGEGRIGGSKRRTDLDDSLEVLDTDGYTLLPGENQGGLDTVSDLSAVQVLVAPLVARFAGEDSAFVLGKLLQVFNGVITDFPSVIG